MSDKKDMEMVDKGWSEMRVLLDREMPRDKRRRPIFWLFFAGGLSLVLGVIASVSFSSGNISSVEKESAHLPQSTPIITQVGGSTMDSKGQTPTVEPRSALQSTENIIEQDEAVEQSTVMDRSRASINDSSTGYASSLYAAPVDRSDADSHDAAPLELDLVVRDLEDSHQIAFADTKVDLSEAATSHNVPAIPHDYEKVYQLPMRMATGIAPMHARSISYFQPLSEMTELVYPLQKTSQWVRPFVFAGLMADTSPHGWGGEVGGGISLGRSRVRPYLLASLGRTVMSGRASTETIILEEDPHQGGGSIAEYVAINFDRQAINPSSSVDIIYALTHAAIESGLDVEMGYGVSVGAGLSYIRYLSVVNQARSYSSPFPEVNEALQPYNVNRKALDDSGDFERNEVGLNLRLRYQISDHLSFGVSYKVGITRLIDSDTETELVNDLGGAPTEDARGNEEEYRRSHFGVSLRYGF